MKNYNNKKGFTLLEILVTVLIIAILSGIAIPNYMRAVEKTRIATHLPLLMDVQKGLVLYYAQRGGYPTTFRKLPVSITNVFTPESDVSEGSPIRAVKNDSLCEIKFTPATDILEYACKANISDGTFGSVGWKFEFTFNNTSNGLVEAGKFFVITASGDRRRDLAKLAISNGWTQMSDGKFEIDIKRD